MANKSTQSAADGSKLAAAETIDQITRLESEIEAKRAEIGRLRMGDIFRSRLAKDSEQNRDELDESAASSGSTPRDEFFGKIILLREKPVADEDQDRPRKIAIGRDRRVPAGGAESCSTDITTLPDMVDAASYDSNETSVASAQPPSHPSSPCSPAGLFDHLLHPLGSPGTRAEESSPPSRRQAGGFIKQLFLPPGHHRDRSDSSETEVVKSPVEEHDQKIEFIKHLFLPPGHHRDRLDSSETEVVKAPVEERDQKIESLEKTIASDTRAMRQMKETIERLSADLFAARQSEKLFRALGSRSSSLEDEVEDLRVENTKLRIACLEMEEERKRVEWAMRTELELLCLETGRYTGYFEHDHDF